jgi:hypothetical protein
MSLVRTEIAKLEQKTRDALIEQEKRAMLANQVFVDDRQAKLYPLANQIATPETYESLRFQDLNSTPSDKESQDLFEFNLKVLSNNNMSFVEETVSKLLQSHSHDSLQYLNSSWNDFKDGLKKQFKSANVSTETFIRFARKYLKDNEPSGSNSNTNLNVTGNTTPQGEKASFHGYTPYGSSAYDNESELGSDSSSDESMEPPVGVTFTGFKEDFLFMRILGDATQNVKAKRDNIKAAAANSVFVEMLVKKFLKIGEKSTYKTKVTNLDPERVIDLQDEIYKALPFSALAKEHKKGKFTKAKTTDSTSGHGLKNRRNGRFIGRGVQSNIKDKYYVDMTHLNNHKFSLKYRSTGKVIVKPTEVSSKQKAVIMDILMNKFDQKRFDALTDGEEKLISQFCTIAGVSCVPKLKKEVEDLKTKMEILIGEITAGNDSDDIRRMLKECTKKLMEKKAITKLEGLTLLNQLQ